MFRDLDAVTGGRAPAKEKYAPRNKRSFPGNVLRLLGALTLLFHNIVPFALASPAADGDAPLMSCDLVAAFPYDLQRKAQGVDYSRIDASKAVPECEAAVLAYPLSGRFQFQLGRALEKANEARRALEAYQRAADLGHAGGLNNLGEFYRDGKWLRRNKDVALGYFAAGAAVGYPEAAFNLATLLLQNAPNGFMIEKAAQLLKLAANAGYPNSAKVLRSLPAQSADTSTTRHIVDLLENYRLVLPESERQRLTSDDGSQSLRRLRQADAASVTEPVRPARQKPESLLPELPRAVAEPPAPVQLPQTPAVATAVVEQRRPSVALRKLLEEGQSEDLLILANTSPSAPNAALSLSGQLTFISGRAALCVGPETQYGFREQVTARLWLQNRKLTSLTEITSCTTTSSLEKLDGVLITRGSIGRLDTVFYNDVAARLEAGSANGFVMESKLDRQNKLDRNEVARASSEQAVVAGRSGLGYAGIANSSDSVCVVAEASAAPIWQLLIERRRQEIEFDLGRSVQTKVVTSDADAAYISGHRGNCGIIVASAEQLNAMFKAFSRDQVKGSYGTVWFTPEMVQEAEASLQKDSESAAQAATRNRQLASQENELRARREEAEGQVRDEKTRELRTTFRTNATALQDSVGRQALALFQPSKGGGDADWVGQAFPDVTNQAVRRAKEGWVFADGASSIVEYGRSKWSGRSLESAVIQVRIKLKNPDIGSYDELCFNLGYQNDTEFSRIRSPTYFACDAAGPLRQWLIGLSYDSQWNAP